MEGNITLLCVSPIFYMKGGMMLTTEKKRKVIIDVLFISVMILVIYFVMKYVAIWTLPFIIGLLVAIILQKPVGFLTKKTKLPRTFWSILLVLLVLLSLFAVIGVVVWRLVAEVDGFVSWLSGLVPDIKQTFTDTSKWFSNLTSRLPEGLATAISEAPGTIVGTVAKYFGNFATSFATGVITEGSGILISVIFSVVASCYITKDYRRIVNFILKQLDDKKKSIVVNAKKLFVTNILKMLRGYIIIMCITFTELFIGLSILKVNYAGVLAVIIAVLDILPVIGTGAVLIPWGIISMIMGNIWLGIGLLILYVVILVIRNIIEPRIIGQQVGLPPIVTLIAMYVGLQTFGVIGMMLTPVAIIILVKLQETGVIHLWNPLEKDETKKTEKKCSKIFFKKQK